MPEDTESPTPEIREIVEEVRQTLGERGWTVTAVLGPGGLRLEFANPLSPALLTLGLGPDPVPSDVRERLLTYIDVQPEFVALRGARPPRGKRGLMGALRGGAGSYGWSSQTFREVTDLLYEARVITREEADWLQAVGPAAMR
jgi:hypothetical protein